MHLSTRGRVLHPYDKGEKFRESSACIQQGGEILEKFVSLFVSTRGRDFFWRDVYALGKGELEFEIVLLKEIALCFA